MFTQLPTHDNDIKGYNAQIYFYSNRKKINLLEISWSLFFKKILNAFFSKWTVQNYSTDLNEISYNVLLTLVIHEYTTIRTKIKKKILFWHMKIWKKVAFWQLFFSLSPFYFIFWFLTIGGIFICDKRSSLKPILNFLFWTAQP